MGRGHPDHKIKEGGFKFFFLPFGPQFGLEVSGGGCDGGGGGAVPPGPTPGFAPAHGLSNIANILLAHVKIMRQ